MTIKKTKTSLYILSAILLIYLLFILMDTLFPFPLPQANQYAVVITTENGTPLRVFPSPQNIWRYPVIQTEVSPLYIEALLHYEDRWLWHHPGFNPFSLFRAFIQNSINGRTISGASTITMQVARLFSPHRRTIPGKLYQIFRALQLEHHLTKQQILNLYLNYAPFGGVIEGVQSASFTYLGKSAKQLTHAEAALLAVLPQSPTRYRPDRNPKIANQARNKVLDRMVSFGIWKKQTAESAKLEQVARYSNPIPMTAPLLARRLKQENPHKQLIQTTIDLSMQQYLEELVLNTAKQLQSKTSIAVLVVENKTLAVKAYIGSADFTDLNRFGHVDMVTAKRSPGSTLKPFLYGMAIEKGIIHSASLLMDIPKSYSGYRPRNFSGNFSGPVSASNALKRSLNIPAVELMKQVGPKYFSARLSRGGLYLSYPTHQKPSLAVILGGTATSLENLMVGFNGFARQGVSGKLRYQTTDPVIEKSMMSTGAAWIIYKLLASQHRPNTANSQQIFNNPNKTLAWKTGTSYGFRDAWSLGVTTDYTIGVWIGRPDGTPSPGDYGAATAAPLLFSIADSIIQQNNILEKPPTVEQTSICWPLGQSVATTSKQHCHQIKQAWVLNKNIPPTLYEEDEAKWMSHLISIPINTNNGLRITFDCNIKHSKIKTIARWPNSATPWLSDEIKQKTHIPKLDPQCQSSEVISSFSKPVILGLENGQIIRPSGNTNQLPTIALQAQGGESQRYWLLDGTIIGETTGEKILNYTFKDAGQYTLTVFDGLGLYDSVQFEVLAGSNIDNF